MKQPSIAIIGLGYVGLPLAVEFAKKYPVIGFDINTQRIKELAGGFDRTLEANEEELRAVLRLPETEKYQVAGLDANTQKTFSEGMDSALATNEEEMCTVVELSESKGLRFSSNVEDLKECTIYIVTVPTPINEFKCPDLTPLLKASQMIGGVLSKEDIVIYESTVYPGCTEEDCVPVLEEFSGLVFNRDFYCGYSPERINPGDKVNTLTKIKKVTSGSTPEVATVVNDLYNSIITAGTHLAPSIKVAEASKAIENAQRDVNISFVNELSLIFDRVGIDTSDVIEAAATKWNFLKYKPGLVGGHCIGVDPYYLAHKAESLGYHPQVILSGRRVNDCMGMFVANKVIKLMIKKGHKIEGANALILGVTFKENCPDTRNSRVVDIYRELKQFGLNVDVYDPHVDAAEVKEEYGITLSSDIDRQYDAIILAVAHDEFLTLDFNQLRNGQQTIIFDTKACLPREIIDGRL